MCDTPIARITGCMSSLRKEVSDSSWNYIATCTRVNKVMLVCLCAGTIKPDLEGDKKMTAVEGNASVYQVNPVSRISGEARAEFFMDVGAWF